MLSPRGNSAPDENLTTRARETYATASRSGATPPFSLKRAAALLTLIVLAALQPGCDELLSKAKGKASNLECEGSVRLVNGEPDYGVTVSLTVSNVGEKGIIKVTPTASTSEGDFTRDQKLLFDANESKNLSYFFDQPTINATGIQCRIKVAPSAD